MCVVSVWLPGSPASFSLRSVAPVENYSLTSITVFMVGIIMSRAGLWITDLTITQVSEIGKEEVR